MSGRGKSSKAPVAVEATPAVVEAKAPEPMDPLAQALSILATTTMDNFQMRKENADLRTEIEDLRKQLTGTAVVEKPKKSKKPVDPDAPPKEKDPKKVANGQRLAALMKERREAAKAAKSDVSASENETPDEQSSEESEK